MKLPIIYPFDLTLLPTNTYLVGGVVRDALLNRSRKILDLDFVLAKDAVSTAKIIANKYQAGFVILDKERQIARVVLKNATLDFAQQEGETLEIDLQRRDFTINAIAYNFHQDIIIDPLQGQLDLKNRMIRMVSESNLQDDPLRLLRAYRQAAQLNFTIENNTQNTINKLTPLLKQVAEERIRTELDYLLKENKLGNYYLTLAWQNRLIQSWFKNTNTEQLKLLDKIDLFTEKLSHQWTEYQNQDWNYLAKITCLVSNKPDIAESELISLKYSRHVIRNVTTVLKYLPKLISCPEMSLTEQYFLFLDLQDIFPVLALLLAVKTDSTNVIEPLLHRYFNPEDPVAHPQPLVTGNDLIGQLSLKPSPQIGKLLTAISIAQIEGKINTVSEAIALANNILNKQESN